MRKHTEGEFIFMNMNLYDEMYLKFINSNAFELGARFPRFSPKSRTFFALAFVYKRQGRVITIKEYRNAMYDEMGENSGDGIDIRHLYMDYGFNILNRGKMYDGYLLKGGEYVFLGFNDVSYGFKKDKRKTITLDFDQKKKEFDYECATCHAKEGRPHRNTGSIVKLEQGHKDPRMSMTNDNIIPQCNRCQMKYLNKVVFDAFGQVDIKRTFELHKDLTYSLYDFGNVEKCNSVNVVPPKLNKKTSIENFYA